MDVTVLNSLFQPIYIVDTYESMIWTDRYYECGDFELYTKLSDDIQKYAIPGNYLRISDSEHIMLIESIEIESNVEDGTNFIAKGRSLESILDRRIVWGLKTVNGDIQTCLKALINEAIISPTDANRKIDNFIFEDNSDENITSINMDAQFTGDNLYDVVSQVCAAYDIGFKITLNSSNQMVFKLFKGANRSYDQSANSFVVFSPYFDNISESNYIEDHAPYKNVVLVGGEGEGSDRKYQSIGTVAGLARRELFVDARDISSNDGEITISESDYNKLLLQRGEEKLAEVPISKAFDGSADTKQMFEYGIDFFIGDKVQIEDAYGHSAASIVTEFIISVDDSGYSAYPTFTAIQS